MHSNLLQFRPPRGKKSAMGGLLRDLGAEPLAAGGNWGSEGKTPSLRGWGSEGRALSCQRHGGLEAVPSLLESFVFFLQK